MKTRTLVYEGPATGGLDFPRHGITAWKPGETREVPEDLAKELLDRGEFSEASPSARKKAAKSEE